MRARALDQLRASMQRVLAGSAWREPDEVLRDCGIAHEGLHETAKLIAAAWGKLDAYARGAGLGGFDRGAAAAPMPRTQPPPAAPRTHSLADIAMFGQNCQTLLQPTALQPVIDQLERARTGVANVTTPHHALRGQAHELSAASSLLGQARQSLICVLERLNSAHHGLERYLNGAVGTPRLRRRPRRGAYPRADSMRVSKQVRAAKDAARTATRRTDRAGALTRRAERHGSKQIKKHDEPRP